MGKMGYILLFDTTTPYVHRRIVARMRLIIVKRRRQASPHNPLISFDD